MIIYSLLPALFLWNFCLVEHLLFCNCNIEYTVNLYGTHVIKVDIFYQNLFSIEHHFG